MSSTNWPARELYATEELGIAYSKVPPGYTGPVLLQLTTRNPEQSVFLVKKREIELRRWPWVLWAAITALLSAPLHRTSESPINQPMTGYSASLYSRALLGCFLVRAVRAPRPSHRPEPALEPE